MLVNKRLIGTVSHSRKYIAGNVALQWCALAANILVMAVIAETLGALLTGRAKEAGMAAGIVVAAMALLVRFFCTIMASRMSYLSSREVKKVLRERIYRKLLQLGSAYRESVQTSEIVQVAVEGVEQLETYFGAYLPQFFYAILASLTLFFVLSFVNLPSAIVLLLCVPMIPITIGAVQKWAKRLLAKYWGEYSTLGDTFLENLQGLTTLKIYQADQVKHQEMNEEAERFRKITMKVLTMQLNSIAVMDLIAFGGAALGVVLAVTQYRAGKVGLEGCLLIILLSADFFIPMRQLGSFFHIAMNGMAASDKIFRLLDLPQKDNKGEALTEDMSIMCRGLDFSYEKDRAVLQKVDLQLPKGSFTAIVGESGCGKSTLASILMGKSKGYTGSVSIGGKELSTLSEESLVENLTYIGHQSYLFKGSVRENLLMGKREATDKEMWEALERVKLARFLQEEKGLDTPLLERASNLSGGQRQRLALARALLHQSEVIIFDEATSNIDVDSENAIMEQIHRLAESKTVILISHRLANVVDSDHIYVMDRGKIVESGKHEKLLEAGGLYQKLWCMQESLEKYGKEGTQR
ncbi:MAG: ABC transporter ATP-binding protein/permease [Lachnospiraceae bacterium]